MRLINRCIILVLVASLVPIYALGSILMQNSSLDKDIVAMEMRSNRHTQVESNVQVINRLTTDGFRLIMENERLEFWLRDVTGAARIVDKESGYVWGALPVDEPDDPGRLNATWRGVAHSLVTIDRFNVNAQSALLGSSHPSVSQTFSVNNNVLTVDANFIDVGISFTYTITLIENGITFELLDDTITEAAEYTLGSVFFFPFLGATVGNEIPGYMFVPDGPGALIRFRLPMNFINIYEHRVFGEDFGIDNLHVLSDLQSIRPNDFMAPEQQIHFPVFGMVHGARQNGFFSVLENGEEHAFVRAAPAGDVTNYNWIAARFVYRQIFHQPVTRAGAGVRTMQVVPNTVNPRQTFYFFNGDHADYVGFALFYRDYLGLKNRIPASNDIPIMLDFVMNDVEQGFIFNSEREVTSPYLVREAVEHILNVTDNVHVNLLGWQRRGLNGHRKLNVHRPRRSYRRLVEDLNELGVNTAFYLNPLRAKTIQIPNNRVGTNLSQSPIMRTRDNPTIWLGEDVFAQPTAMLDTLRRQVNALENHRIALDDLPGLLFSEHHRNNPLTRREVRKLYVDFARSMGTIPMYRPNVYMLPYAESFISTPMVNSQFIFQTDTVPFLQIVLSGTIPMFAPYSNVSFHGPIDILKHIDFNTYPSFLLTEEENHRLMRTTLVDFHSTAYINWREQMVFVYGQINNILRHVIGQAIQDRVMLAEGVVRNRYESGVIIVNYTANDFIYNGVTVAAISAKFIER